jgi:hypothetical protein
MSANIGTANTNMNRTVLLKKRLIIWVQFSDEDGGTKTALSDLQSYFKSITLSRSSQYVTIDVECGLVTEFFERLHLQLQFSPTFDGSTQSTVYCSTPVLW